MALTFSPTQTGGVSLTVVDYRNVVAKATGPDDSGTLTAVFDPVPDGFLWRVERIVISCDSGTDTQAALYAGDPSPLTLVDSTQSGNMDTADEASPILVDSSVSLTCQWVNADPGSTGVCRVQYQLVART